MVTFPVQHYVAGTDYGYEIVRHTKANDIYIYKIDEETLAYKICAHLQWMLNTKYLPGHILL